MLPVTALTILVTTARFPRVLTINLDNLIDPEICRGGKLRLLLKIPRKAIDELSAIDNCPKRPKTVAQLTLAKNLKNLKEKWK